jgi:hypothetical protein
MNERTYPSHEPERERLPLIGRPIFWCGLASAVFVGYLLGNVLPWSPATTPATVASSQSQLGSSDTPVVAQDASVPAPVSDAQLASMSRSELQALLGQISRARQIPTLDDATKLRLKDDFARTLARAKSASEPGASVLSANSDGSSADVPGPFSDGDIDAMTKAEAQAVLGRISRARQIPTLDDATKQRLKDDFNRVLVRAKVAKK